MKTVLFRYEEEIVTTLSIGYDKCHCSRLSFLYGGSIAEIQKTPRPPCLCERENVHPIQDSRDWTDVCTRYTFVFISARVYLAV
jgi:hypothetical protein